MKTTRAYRIRDLFDGEHFVKFYVAPLGMEPHIGISWTRDADLARPFKTKLAAEAVQQIIRESLQRGAANIIVETCYVPQEV